MKLIDSFLARQQVDVGRSLGLLSFASAVWSFYTIFGHLLAGVDFSLSTGPLLGAILGVALWRHKSWSRTLLLVFSWFTVLGSIAVLVLIPFCGTQKITLDYGSVILKNPPVWKAVVGVLATVPLQIMGLGVLCSNKAKAEFKKPN